MILSLKHYPYSGSFFFLTERDIPGDSHCFIKNKKLSKKNSCVILTKKFFKTMALNSLPFRLSQNGFYVFSWTASVLNGQTAPVFIPL